MSKKKGGFWSDFKAFITRGNVVDMAVGVVIGGAFGKIVTGLVNYIINPCVSLLTDGTDLDNIKTVLRKGVEATEGVEAVPEVAILWGTWIQTILDFILVAFCIFLVLRVMMHAKNRLDAKKIAAAGRHPPAGAAAGRAGRSCQKQVIRNRERGTRHPKSDVRVPLFSGIGRFAGNRSRPQFPSSA